MYLNRIVLPVLDVEGIATFYRTTLDVPVVVGAGTATVSIGRTRLDLRAEDEGGGSHHLALNVPRDTLGAARSWLAPRARLLDRDGVYEFEGPPSWNSRSLYFEGPEGAVLELIERRDLPPGRSSTFSAKQLICVSEVGIAVPNVEQTVALLQEEAGLEPYGGALSPDFAAVGDVHGLLILVRPGRAWMPTTDRHVAVASTIVEAAGPRPGHYRLGDRSVVHVAAAHTGESMTAR